MEYQRCSLECLRVDLVILYTCGYLFIPGLGKMDIANSFLVADIIHFCLFMYFQKPCRAKGEQIMDNDCHWPDNKKHMQGCFFIFITIINL